MNFTNWLGTLPGVVAQGLIWGIMAIGVFITFKILDIADLTVDGSICTGAAVCAVLVTVYGVNIWVAILAATVAGVLCGLVTGLIHTLLGIPAILAGILTQLMLWSVNLILMGKSNVALPGQVYHVAVSNLEERLLQTNLTLILFVAGLIALLYWFFGTELGSSLRATGNNLHMSRAQGINTDFAKVLGLMISNGIVAMSGALLAQFSGSADINMGRGAIVIGLAAVVVGEAVVSKLSSGFIVRLLGVALGGVCYYFVFSTIVFLGLRTDLLKMFSALVVAFFLGMPYVKKRYFKKAVKGGKKDA